MRLQVIIFDWMKTPDYVELTIFPNKECSRALLGFGKDYIYLHFHIFYIRVTITL